MVTRGPVSSRLLHQSVVAAANGQNRSSLPPPEGWLLIWFLWTEPRASALTICCGLLPRWCLTQGTIAQRGCRFETSKFFRQMEFWRLEDQCYILKWLQYSFALRKFIFTFDAKTCAIWAELASLLTFHVLWGTCCQAVLCSAWLGGQLVFD